MTRELGHGWGVCYNITTEIQYYYVLQITKIQEDEGLKKEMETARVKAKVKEIEEDFMRRRQARLLAERGWEINMNFYSGHQYCDVTPNGEIAEEDKQFYWQSRRVFNQIAPIVDTRLAVLAKNAPALHVRAFSDEQADVARAAMAEGILRAASDKLGLTEVISRATLWSEVCGTAFYKIVWDGEGDEVSVIPVSPFEIFPDSMAAERVEDLHSIIQARAVPVREIAEKYGVELPGRAIDEFAALPYASAAHWKCVEGESMKSEGVDYELLIERYTMPEFDAPNGKLEIVAGGKLLYDGVLPYRNGEGGARVLPFVRQTSLPQPGALFGTSIVDRLIPLQRAYNAVRNRKHEFLNRLSMGVIAVEDGSVDVDELAEEGLCPGKVVVYRQGTTPPSMMDLGSMPAEFAKEEEILGQEFRKLSGTTDSEENGYGFSGVTSATGLQLLLNREEEKMAVPMGSMRRAAEEVARHILRLYKQFATNKRLARMGGENRKTEVFYFNAGDITSDNILFDGANELTAESKRSAVMEMISMGVLKEKDGTMSEETKEKVAGIFGLEGFVGGKDISELHRARANRENRIACSDGKIGVEEYDDHEVHVREHLRYVLSEEFEANGRESVKKALSQHIAKHRALMNVAGVDER
jgi:hypothetical protein